MNAHPSRIACRARASLAARIALTCVAVALAILVGGTLADSFDVFTPLLQALHG